MQRSARITWVVASTFVLGVTILAALSVLFPVPRVQPPWGIYALVGAILILAEVVHVTIGHGSDSERLSLMSVAMVITAYLLPAVPAVVFAAIAMAIVPSFRRLPVQKIFFNVSMQLAAGGAQVLAYRSVTGGYNGHNDALHRISGVAVLAALAGAVAYSLVNDILISRIIAATGGPPVVTQLRDHALFSSATVLASLVLGTLFVAVLAASPVLLPLTVFPALYLVRIFRSRYSDKMMRERTERLIDLGHVLATGLDPTQMIPSFLALTRQTFDANDALALLDLPRGLEVFAVTNTGQERRPASEDEVRIFSTFKLSPHPHALEHLPERWLSAAVAPLELDDRVLGMVLIAAESDRLQSDPALLGSMASSLSVALSNSALYSHLDAITASQGESVVALDAEGRVTFLNPSAQQMLEPPPTMGEVPSFAIELDSERLDAVALVAAATSSPVRRSRAVLCQGELSIPVSLTVSPITLAEDDFSLSSSGGVVVVLDDISARVAAEDALESSRAEIISFGQTLQSSLLPGQLPSIPGFELSARYHSAADGLEVGGDFYDVFPSEPNGWSLVMGDVCGRGAKAAALTALTRHTLRATGAFDPSPLVQLRHLNRAVLRNGDERFCTVLAATLEPVSRRLTLACGGHPPALVCRSDGRVEELGAAGTLIGVVEELIIDEVSATLNPGDFVIFYTDGVTEARSQTGEFLDVEGLGAWLSTRAGQCAELVASELDDFLSDFEGGAISDDTAFLVLSVL